MFVDSFLRFSLFASRMTIWVGKNKLVCLKLKPRTRFSILTRFLLLRDQKIEAPSGFIYGSFFFYLRHLFATICFPSCRSLEGNRLHKWTAVPGPMPRRKGVICSLKSWIGRQMFDTNCRLGQDVMWTGLFTDGHHTKEYRVKKSRRQRQSVMQNHMRHHPGGIDPGFYWEMSSEILVLFVVGYRTKQALFVKE